MDLGLEWHQEQLREVARGFLAKHCKHATLRALEATDTGYSRETHRKMAELGWLELALGSDSEPEDLIDVVLLYEEYGRAAAPGPHFGTTVLAGPVLRAGGLSDLLGAIAAGEHVVAVALYEETAGYDAGSVQLAAAVDGEQAVLTGRKMFVPYALGADSLLVLARTGQAAEQLTWALVPADAAGIAVTPLHAMSNDKLFQVDLDGVTGTVVGPVDGGWAVLQDLLPRATVVQAAELVGLADAAFQMAVEYSKVRIAFGRPIGAFQVIQHKCADMLADCDGARYLVYQAACLINAGRHDAPEVAMAKAFATAAARRVTKEAHQIYAGHGFVLENSLNYYYRRQKTIELGLADAGEQLDRVADLLAAA